ncbi:hypothetical protein RO3G_04534 [Lichtheimia corymbifera JMRC:FSU:9682]|uniref:Pathogen-related protein n=1 Tax=Lichtheimia corymbifera JMRC:FSU:9682 TaxID=1263082 RepID=A0A068RNR6_9FUNG|nr:hypothetical protein RO3G_04534 [Lichtheimia corymbifera JMRC:FSU:9682]
MAADLPDFMTDPNAVLKDTEHEWRYKRVPDYKKVNEAYEQEKSVTHEEGSLSWLVSNLVKIGTYNALIGDTELYKASEADFSESHKLFKRALRTFSWEVLEVYSGPPTVAFKWRHWGTMVGDLSVNLGNGEKLEAAATNEVVETFGVTVAKVNEKFEIESLETFYDPSQLMRQMAKNRKDNGNNATTSGAPKCPFAPK